MRIQHNISALNTSQALAKNQKATQSNLAKLSSGYSINKAADNAAGLAISEKMRGQIRGLTQAKKNATDGINLINTAEGYMSTANDILQRMRELAVQSANGTYDSIKTNTTASSDGDRAKINEEIQQLTDELDRLADTANFNGMKLSNKDFQFQIGAETKGKDGLKASSNGVNYGKGAVDTITSDGLESANVKGTNSQIIKVKIGGFDSESLKVDKANINLTTQVSANKAIDVINDAIAQVTSYRARLGAAQNRLEYTVDNLDTSIQNTTASESAIRDTDMVSEMMSFTKNNVLNQAATAMMAQANSQTQSVLQLLQ